MNEHNVNEIVSLNFEDLDVTELERRLELAVIEDVSEPLGWCIGACTKCGDCEDCPCYSLCPSDSFCPGDHTM